MLFVKRNKATAYRKFWENVRVWKSEKLGRHNPKAHRVERKELFQLTER